VTDEKHPAHAPSERDYKKAFFELLGKQPDLCAYRVVTPGQKLALWLSLAVLVAWAAWDWVSLLLVVNGFFIVYYLVLSAWKFWLIDESLASKREIVVTPQEVAALRDEECPPYTILVPLYHETETLPRLVGGLAKLDYPKDKLDVIFLLEEDDKETREAFGKITLPAWVRGVVCPDMQPKTKPKACNLGLALARGQYLVIYDAEDRPEPDQLKKAVVAFRTTGPEVACIQAKLNYYNPRQNLLTRLFTIEYSMWFDLFLPGLDYLKQPIPLGGTSNHFVTARLREMHGWDAFNVTEDCDLGVRMAAAGAQTRILDSTTWEEACSHPHWWVRQRSRWIKGYIQTYLVHCRRPVAMFKRLGFWKTFGFHMMIGGTPICLLINPFYWLMAIFWVVFRSEAVATFFPFPIILFAAACLFVGNFVFLYAGVLAAYRRGYYDLVKTALLMPIYWIMMSIGAWKGFIQIITKPSFWEKTKHGLDIAASAGGAPPENKA
jgi:glycosyltransferase XagB